MYYNNLFLQSILISASNTAVLCQMDLSDMTRLE